MIALGSCYARVCQCRLGITRRHPATVRTLNVSNNASTGDVAVGWLLLVLTAWLVNGLNGVPAGGVFEVPIGALVPVVVLGAKAYVPTDVSTLGKMRPLSSARP